MSNNVTIQYTIFVDLDSEGAEEHTHYGYRIYDEYDSRYNNGFWSFEDVRKKVNPDNIWEFLGKSYPDFYEIAKFKKGVFLNDDWLELKE